MAGGFKRSGRLGLIGVIVVAIVIAIVASTAGNEANPKGTMALIFGVLAVFVVILLVLQRSDLERTAGGDVKAVQRAVAEGGGRIDDPTKLDEPQLWAALAIEPIDDEALEARTRMWEPARRSQKLGWIVMALIFLTVPSIYLFESFVPLLIGGPLIVIAAVYGSVRALMPGGELDSGYARIGTAMAPLGLAVTERPKVRIEQREWVGPSAGRMGPAVHGVLGLEGERHGRRVSIRAGEGASTVTVREPCHEFSAASKKVKVKSGPEGIAIVRKGGAQAEWLCDLWLAERLAGAA
jgi:hypothetical protein